MLLQFILLMALKGPHLNGNLQDGTIKGNCKLWEMGLSEKCLVTGNVLLKGVVQPASFPCFSLSGCEVNIFLHCALLLWGPAFPQAQGNRADWSQPRASKTRDQRNRERILSDEHPASLHTVRCIKKTIHLQGMEASLAAMCLMLPPLCTVTLAKRSTVLSCKSKSPVLPAGGLWRGPRLLL